MQKLPEIPYNEFRKKYENMSLNELESTKNILDKIIERQEIIIDYLKTEEDNKVNKEELKLRNLKGERRTLEKMHMRRCSEKCNETENVEKTD